MRVDFHFNVGADALRYTARLLHKAHQAGARCVVWSSADQCRELDRTLWEMGSQGFLPHVHMAANHPPEALALSAVLLTSDAAHLSTLAAHGYTVLVNLTQGWGEPAWGYARLIEIVPTDEALKQQARQRWRRHLQEGREPQGHDALAQRG